MKSVLFCFLAFFFPAIAAGDVELPVADLEPPANPMVGPLDRWGDWLRGSETWRLSRRIVADAAQGRAAVCTEPTPKDPAQAKGWYFSGLRVDGAEWVGMTEFRFWAKGSRSGPCRLTFCYDESPWAGKKYVATHQITLGTEWREYRIPTARMKIYTDPPAKGEFSRTRAVSWIIEGEQNSLFLDDIRVVIPESRWQEVRRKRSRRRLAVLTRDLRILATVLRVAPVGAQALDEVATALNAGDSTRAAVALDSLQRVRAGMLTARGLRRRIAHYQDKLAAVPDAPLASRLAALSRELDELRRTGRFDTLRWTELERGVDHFWLAAQPLFAGQHSRLRPYAKGSSWYRPGGRRLVPLAPHSMYTMFTPDSSWRQAREVDYQRLAQWGCNGTRLEVKWFLLEPKKGEFDPEYLAMVERVLEWCDKHGMYACIDLHWPYPDWFYAGPPEARNPNREQQNPYFWPEAVLDAYRRLVPALADHPNILAWEVPTNEPAISSIEVWKVAGNQPTIQDIPALMRSWNQWLLKKYGSRQALDRQWREASRDADRNGLAATEDPAAGTVLPPGCRGVGKADCRRIYDYMEWSVQSHTGLCGEIAQVIHQTLPGAVTQQQWPAGGARWEHDPIPVNYRPWMQIHAPNVQVATHYGVGHDAAYISTLGCPSTNSEEQANGRQGIYARHRARGQGTSPFTLFPIKHGFCDWDFNMKDSTAWLMAVGEFWDDATRIRPKPVLVLVNSRTAAIGGGSTGLEARALLEAMDVEYDLASTAYVVANPAAVKRYAVVLGTLAYADAACLTALEKSGRPVLLLGSPQQDVRGRTDLATRLVGAGILLGRVPKTWGSAAVPASVDLVGQWRFRIDPDGRGSREHWEARDHADAAWESQAVPAYWENTGVLNKGRVYDGVAWYRRTFSVPDAWQGRDVVLEFGGIDDLDQTFVNGTCIGSTDEKTPEYWRHHRRYPVGKGILRYGAENVLAVRVTDLRGDGGIWRPPVQLSVPGLCKARLTADLAPFLRGAALSARIDDDAPRILPLDLASGSRILASFPGGEAALVRWRNILWWLGEDQLSLDSAQSHRLVAALLSQTDVPRTFPATAGSRLLQTHEYATAFTVSTASRQPVTATLRTNLALVDMEGYPLAQTFGLAGTSTVQVRTPWASNASFLRKTSLRIEPRGADLTLHEFRVVDTSSGRELRGTSSGARTTLTLAVDARHLSVQLVMGARRTPFRRTKKGLVAELPAGDHAWIVEVKESGGSDWHRGE
ncbi:MAG: cellulase family glycosylhydrolase [Victivallales bacterium]|nr:cellulase family glycosylhydrolase [Victivallales bacterium]